MIHARPAAVAAVLAAFAVAAPAPAAPQGKKLYCWEEEGRTICGDALPADAADNARREFNARTGRQVGEVGPALTAEERAALEAERTRQEREAEDEAARALRELAMARSYATEEDLRRAFALRTTLMDDKVQASRIAITNLRQGLLTRLRTAGELELAGKPVGAELAAAIAAQHEAVRRQRDLLASQQAERAALDLELESTVARYRELTGTAQPDGEQEGSPETAGAASEG